jgi:Fe2+ or Zn2+ uptake regulation protein
MNPIIRRKSTQREKIYHVIKSSTSHPTAQWVYDQIRKELPSASMGNVYRNIKILIEQGRILSRNFGDDIEHYDAITNMHYHFICNKCGSISDFNMPIQTGIEEEAKKRTNNLITGHTIQFFGLCKKCKKKEAEDERQRKIDRNI